MDQEVREGIQLASGQPQKLSNQKMPERPNMFIKILLVLVSIVVGGFTGSTVLVLATSIVFSHFLQQGEAVLILFYPMMIGFVIGVIVGPIIGLRLLSKKYHDANIPPI